MGDTTKVVGQREVGRCPGWRRHLWNSVSDSFVITGSICTRWPNCAPATALAARPATSGSRASKRAAASGCGIAAARRQHPSWGAGKLLTWLQPRHPGMDWPAVSTAGDLLARRGLVKKRRRRRHWQHPGVVPATTTEPHDLWTADFKGHFRTRDGLYGYPLT